MESLIRKYKSIKIERLYNEVSFLIVLILLYVSDSEINTIGKSKLGSLWLGVYPIDKIPFLTEGCFVVNTQTSTLPGEHWLAVNITKT